MAKSGKEPGEAKPFQEGEIVRLDDQVTDFDFGKIGRPNCIARLVGSPLQLAYVVPRTTDG